MGNVDSLTVMDCKVQSRVSHVRGELLIVKDNESLKIRAF